MRNRLIISILLSLMPLAYRQAAYGQPSCKLQTLTIADGLPSSTITMCATDPDGLLWIATWNGLCNYDGYRLNSFAAKPGKELTSNRIRHIIPLGGGDVWLETFDEGKYLFRGKERRYIDYSGKEKPSPAARPKTVKPDSLGVTSYTDNDGTQWQLRPDGSFGYTDEQGKGFTQVMSGMSMNKIMADTRGNLWFTGTHNLYMLSFRNYSFHHKTVIANSESRSVETDRQGRVFVGTRSGHLAVLDTDGNILGHVTPNGGLSMAETRFCDKGIYALHHDRQGILWVGTRGAGIFKLSPAGSGFSISKFQLSDTGSRNTASATQPSTPSEIFDINEDTQGRVWIGTYKEGAMVVTPDGKLIASLKLPEGNARKVRRIERGKGNTMILSTADGLFTASSDFTARQEPHLFRTEHKPEVPTSLMASDVLHAIRNRSDNSILLSTMGGGLQATTKADLLSDNLPLTVIEGLTDGLGNIQALLQDTDGRIWVIGENTIRCLNSTLQECAVYSSNEWGTEVEFSEAKPAVDPHTGNIYIATSDGIILFNPNSIRQSDFIPSLVFSGVQYQGDERITPLAGCEVLPLPTEKHNAIVYFAALDYGNNSLIRYAWRICELDTAWSYVGAEHCAPLSNLPPGRFTLEVRSTNSDGQWVDNNATLTINVEPTFWQSRWAWLIYITIICGILYTAYYIIRLRNNAKIEREMAERKLRLFTNVNSQLRTPLTLIGGPVTEVLQTEQLSEQGRNILEFVERNASDMISILDKETKAAEPDPFQTALTEFIEQNISNENLKIEDIAAALNVSRSVLYNKVKTFYDTSPIDLVRDMRIKRACRLLAEDNKLNISEIAYATGFNEPKYFARTFKHRVGQTPSEYRRNARGNSATASEPPTADS